MDIIAQMGNAPASVILRVVLMEFHIAHRRGPRVRVELVVHAAQVVLLDTGCVHLGQAGKSVDRGLLFACIVASEVLVDGHLGEGASVAGLAGQPGTYRVVLVEGLGGFVHLKAVWKVVI